MQRLKDWLRGVKEAAGWIAESFWNWLRHPPANPKHWFVVIAAAFVLASCDPPAPPGPTPNPSPTPTVEPTPTPVPPPEGCTLPTNAGDWTELGMIGAEHPEWVTDAEAFIGSVCGQEPEVSLDKLANEMRTAGRCAGRVDDSVFVERSDKKWDQMKAVDFVSGCWWGDFYAGSWNYERP